MAVNYSLTALSGINSASSGLGVISNNISNAQTIGFKASRVEFADMFYGNQKSPGQGTRTQTVYQNFSQGAVNDTGNVLDLALNGEGFFVMDDTTGRYSNLYTRNGSFKLDKEGYVVDQSGNRLMGYNKNQALSTDAAPVFKTVLEPMNIGELNKTPKATGSLNMDLNLNGQSAVTYQTTSSGGRQSQTGVPFTVANLANMTYDGPPNWSTSKMVYDSLGGEHRLSINYFKVQVNPSGIYPTSNDSNGNQVGYNQETTDWYAQYIMEDYNDSLGKWVKSGALNDAADVGDQSKNAYDVTSMLNFSTPGAVTATQTNFIDDARNMYWDTVTNAYVARADEATPTEAKNALDAVATFGSIYQPGTSTARTQVDVQKSTYDTAISMGATVSQANIAAASAFGSYGATTAAGAAQAAYDQAILAKDQGGLGMTNTEALSAAGVAYYSYKDLTDAQGTYAAATPVAGGTLLTGSPAKDNALMAFSAINFALGPLTSTDTDGTTALDTAVLGLQVDDGTGTLTPITPTATVTFGGAIITDKQRDVNLFGFNKAMDSGFSSTSANIASLFKIEANASAAEHVPGTTSEAFEAAYQTALSVGLTQAQASQAAKASYDAFASAEAFNAAGGLSAGALGYLNPAQEAFNAAFGASGSVPSVSSAYVHAYRFNSDGKILDFNEKGNFAAVAGNTTIPDKVNANMSWYLDNPNPAGGVGTTEALEFDVDLSKFTQYGGSYNVRGVSQDGYKVGDLVGVVVNSNGMIEARYSNGRSDSVSRVALANFPDLQGMEKLGSQTWAESFASGPRSLGQPQESGFASIQSGALEYSNVDVTGELVNMIFMQKMYQASAQVISTDKQLTQTILQL